MRAAIVVVVRRMKRAAAGAVRGERQDAVVTIDEILDSVWSDRFVPMSAVSSRIAAVRRATGDDGRSQRIIRTVRSKGFSFVAELR